jgi:hypothetical protein
MKPDDRCIGAKPISGDGGCMSGAGRERPWSHIGVARET